MKLPNSQKDWRLSKDQSPETVGSYCPQGSWASKGPRVEGRRICAWKDERAWSLYLPCLLCSGKHPTCLGHRPWRGGISGKRTNGRLHEGNVGNVLLRVLSQEDKVTEILGKERERSKEDLPFGILLALSRHLCAPGWMEANTTPEPCSLPSASQSPARKIELESVENISILSIAHLPCLNVQSRGEIQGIHLIRQSLSGHVGSSPSVTRWH